MLCIYEIRAFEVYDLHYKKEIEQILLLLRRLSESCSVERWNVPLDARVCVCSREKAIH